MANKTPNAVYGASHPDDHKKAGYVYPASFYDPTTPLPDGSPDPSQLAAADNTQNAPVEVKNKKSGLENKKAAPKKAAKKGKK